MTRNRGGDEAIKPGVGLNARELRLNSGEVAEYLDGLWDFLKKIYIHESIMILSVLINIGLLIGEYSIPD